MGRFLVKRIVAGKKAELTDGEMFIFFATYI